MNSRCPLPARASFRDLLRDLLGRPVTVRPGPAQELDPTRSSYLAAYQFDDGPPAAVAVTDQALSLALAAATGSMPPKETFEQVDSDGGLDQELVEFLREVLDVSAKLLNSPTTGKVVLRHLAPVPGEVAADVAAMARNPAVRQDWQVGVEGYGAGAITFMG